MCLAHPILQWFHAVWRYRRIDHRAWHRPSLRLYADSAMMRRQADAAAGRLAGGQYVGYLLGALFTVFSHGDRIQRLRRAAGEHFRHHAADGPDPRAASVAVVVCFGLSNGVVFVYAANPGAGATGAGRALGAGWELLYSGVGRALFCLACWCCGGSRRLGLAGRVVGAGADLRLAACNRRGNCGQPTPQAASAKPAQAVRTRLSAGGGGFMAVPGSAISSA